MADLNIKFIGYQGEASVHTRASKVFGDSLARQLGDTAVFEHLPNITADGRKAADILGLVESGEQTACYFASSYLADRFPSIAVLDLPFAVTDRQKTYDKLDGALGERLKKEIAANSDYLVLGFWDNGFRHISSRVRAIRAPGDGAGQVIRTGDAELHRHVFRMLGFEPRYLDVRDLAGAVASGEVDAQDNSLTNIYNFEIYMHHPYITLTAHFIGICPMLCHRPSYESWTDTQRAAVDRAAAEATAAQRRFAIDEERAVEQRLVEFGNEVVHLTEDERAALAGAVQPVIDEATETLGRELVGLLLE